MSEKRLAEARRIGIERVERLGFYEAAGPRRGERWTERHSRGAHRVPQQHRDRHRAHPAWDRPDVGGSVCSI
jgi:hypothetical protein